MVAYLFTGVEEQIRYQKVGTFSTYSHLCSLRYLIIMHFILTELDFMCGWLVVCARIKNKK